MYRLRSRPGRHIALLLPTALILSTPLGARKPLDGRDSPGLAYGGISASGTIGSQ